MLHLWSAKLEIGLPKIDEQHKELFRQVGILMDRTKADRIPETLKFLGGYVLKHFTDEQGIQASINYPKAEAHKKLHTAFVSKFSELRKKFEDSGDNLKFEVVTEINSTAIGWLKDHIMIHDREFADYYKQYQQARLPGGLRTPRPVCPAPPRLWRPELETGIPKLDAQHKEIFRRAEILLDGVNGEAMSCLGECLAKHFGAEERVQAEIGYPAAGAHQRNHNDFRRKFKDMYNKQASAPPADRATAARGMGQILVGWLRDHIVTHDQDFAVYYINHRRGGRKKRGFLYRLFHPFCKD
ncbi:MAG: bacteriohemerythrin [Deltaproteobacteria bacterium]|nr:bacteriohemerythrin [Deltaproteobacteria bacterium]